MLSIGRMLKAERLKQGYTAQELADGVGVSIRTIWNVETDKGGSKAIGKILDFLCLDIIVQPKSDSSYVHIP